jgi:hypothetical protein
MVVVMMMMMMITRGVGDVLEDAAVKDVCGAVVGARGHEGVARVVAHAAHGLGVVLERPVRHGRQVQIEPHHAPVVAAHQHVVACGGRGRSLLKPSEWR